MPSCFSAKSRCSNNEALLAGATDPGTASRPGIRSMRVTGRISAGVASGGIRNPVCAEIRDSKKA